MASTPTRGESPSSRQLAIGIAVLLLLVAAVVLTSFLGKPWSLIVEMGFFVFVVCLVALQLRECLRLTEVSAHRSQLMVVGVFVASTVLFVVGEIGNQALAKNTSCIGVATNLGVYVALLLSLELVKVLLSGARGQLPVQSGSTTEAGTKPAGPK